MNFWSKLDTPLDFFAFLLVLCVTFVNGFTDAPNSIHSSVRVGGLSVFGASLISGFFNFLGVFVSSLLFFSVGKSVCELASANGGSGSLMVCACLITVTLVGALAWVFKMPSSESHALLFSLMGARLCLGEAKEKYLLSLFYIVFSICASSFLSYLLSRFFVKKISPHLKIKRILLTLSCSVLSFMHGAQDGQKLLAILLVVLGVGASGKTKPPLILIILIGAVMCISTLLSGKRILSSMDELSENTDTSSVFFADFAVFSSLAVSSVFGFPVSTSNIKSASVYATEQSPKIKSKRAIIKIFLTSIITLPISFVLGFIICKLLILLT